jgi:ankyrin repeat protein
MSALDLREQSRDLQEASSTASGTAASLHESAASGDVGSVRRFLSAGKDISGIDESQRTPLHVAIMSDHADVACVLVEAKAELGGADLYGNTPLQLAAIQGHVEVAKVLVASGFEVNSCNAKSGRTLLHNAAGNIHSNVDMLSFLLENRAIVDAVNERDMVSPLHEAVAQGYEDRVALLHQYKASVDVKDASGRNPLHKAASGGKLQIVSFLLKSQASLDEEDSKFAYTPLHLATISGHKDVIHMLLQNGARRDAKTKNGRTPLYFAKNRNDAELIRLLTPPRRLFPCMPW